MIHPLDYLDEIGLSKSEAQLYLAGLEQGKTGVAQLVQSTGIKRPTAYSALNQLTAKGLADETKEGKELRYVMYPPTELKSYIEGRLSSFARSAAQLTEVVDLFPSPKPQIRKPFPVRHFIGPEEIKRAIDLALYCTSRRWDIVAPLENFIAKRDRSYIRYFKTTRQTQGIVSRSLWENKSVDKDLTLRDLVNRKPRYLPRRYAGTFSGMLILFDDKVLFVGLEEAVLLQGHDTYNLCSLMFDGLWSIADKP